VSSSFIVNSVIVNQDLTVYPMMCDVVVLLLLSTGCHCRHIMFCCFGLNNNFGGKFEMGACLVVPRPAWMRVG
jgi:hypothetical protein